MAKIEPTVVTPANTEPPVMAPPASGPTLVATTPAETAAPVTEPRKLDQLSRIEDKTARRARRRPRRSYWRVVPFDAPAPHRPMLRADSAA